ncbi:NT-C2 domain-containing protein [Gossypium australe]|uniref:NT-C2 domain-containing protein n=1 Tax=Gossypium australe TaxID=47621 RepID=A0A5B6VZ13_9ROSI|nr:NT-C2 domain-containing protein [Gossypium australe]
MENILSEGHYFFRDFPAAQSLLLQWENGDKSSGSLEWENRVRQSFRLQSTNRDGFQKNCLEFYLYEPRKDKVAKGQRLGSAVVNLSDYGTIRETISIRTPINLKKSLRNIEQPVLYLNIQPFDKVSYLDDGFPHEREDDISWKYWPHKIDGNSGDFLDYENGEMPDNAFEGHHMLRKRLAINSEYFLVLRDRRQISLQLLLCYWFFAAYANFEHKSLYGVNLCLLRIWSALFHLLRIFCGGNLQILGMIVGSSYFQEGGVKCESVVAIFLSWYYSLLDVSMMRIVIKNVFYPPLILSRFPQSSLSPKHLSSKVGHDLTTLIGERYNPIQTNYDIRDLPAQLGWPFFETEDAKDSLSLLSEG